MDDTLVKINCSECEHHLRCMLDRGVSDDACPNTPFYIEDLARQLHLWYLEATKKLNPGSYNPTAQKSFNELTEEQKSIDRYIAKRIKNAVGWGVI